MFFVVIPILVGCLSVMTVRGRREGRPAGPPVARPRLVAAGGTYDGSRGRPSDAYVIQERLIAAAHGAGSAEHTHTAAALALASVVAARPQRAGTREKDLGECARAAHRAARAAALPHATGPAASGSTPAGSAGTGPVSSLDLAVLDQDQQPRLRYAHVGDGAIWHCAKGEEPRPLTTAHGFDGGLTTRGSGLPAALTPETGTLPLRSGDRVAIVTEGVARALGAARLKALLASGSSPAACLDRLYDEMSALEPEGDATVIIADVVTA
ncbi:protein phosphatase 2C domain-containing protein [Nonomuraea sp. B1E8]|uniref:protein phosphatase 2C domain-containing protein n=1 Tax=unclassified Nonomuraea TaxID=2593643 RepID=UPI00325E5224